MREKFSDSSNKLFQLRPFLVEDADYLYEIVQNPAVYPTLRQLPSLERSEVHEWATQMVNGRYRLILTHDDKPIGYGSLQHNLRPRMHHMGELTLYTAPSFWGQGAGTRLLNGLLDIADNWLNLNRIELEVNTDNARAIQLYEKAGFDVEGTSKCKAFGNGQWQDSHLMARLRNIARTEPTQGWTRTTPTKPRPDNIVIRPFAATDVPAFYETMTHPGVSRTTLQLPASELQEYQNRITPKSPTGHRLAAAVDGKMVGNISIFTSTNPRMAHSAGLGMSVHPDYWGMGVGSMLMEAILDIADNWLNLKRVELDVNIDNPAGVRLYQKFGFVIEGTKRFHNFGDGRWVDSYFMGRIKE